MTGEELNERLDELVSMVEQVQATQRLILQVIQPAADARHKALIDALVSALEEFDLPFSSQEVADRAAQHQDLDEALRAYGVIPSDTAGIGTLFRTLRDRCIGGLRIVRDGRDWRIARCTSRT